MRRYPDDDPARGIFYGPPDDEGQLRRWSRAWYDWRSGAGLLESEARKLGIRTANGGRSRRSRSPQNP